MISENRVLVKQQRGIWIHRQFFESTIKSSGRNGNYGKNGRNGNFFVYPIIPIPPIKLAENPGLSKQPVVFTFTIPFSLVQCLVVTLNCASWSGMSHFQGTSLKVQGTTHYFKGHLLKFKGHLLKFKGHLLKFKGQLIISRDNPFCLRDKPFCSRDKPFCSRDNRLFQGTIHFVQGTILIYRGTILTFTLKRVISILKSLLARIQSPSSPLFCLKKFGIVSRSSGNAFFNNKTDRNQELIAISRGDTVQKTE